jgi:proteasome lid subunit RPN8/RPN11
VALNDRDSSEPTPLNYSVEFSGSARANTWAHARSDTSNEQGGLLLGTIDHSGRSVQIDAALPATAAQSRTTSLTFTHETWDQLAADAENDHPDASIVGWYHSHPGFGIFLSEHDQFIQTHFFNQPWQVAWVVDPLTERDGLFGWASGRIVRVDDWTRATFSSAGESRVDQPPTPVARTEGPMGERRSRRTAVLLAAVAAVALLIGLVIGLFTFGGQTIRPGPTNLDLVVGPKAFDAPTSTVSVQAMAFSLQPLWDLALRLEVPGQDAVSPSDTAPDHAPGDPSPKASDQSTTPDRAPTTTTRSELSAEVAPRDDAVRIPSVRVIATGCLVETQPCPTDRRVSVTAELP